MAHLGSAHAAWGSRAAGWGHWGPQMLIGAIFAAIALVLKPLPPGTPAALLAPLCLVMFLLISWLQMRQHDRRLCERCMASMPLNPSEAAARYRRRFTVTHLGTDWRLLALYVAMLLSSNVFLMPGVPQTPGHIAWACIQSSMVYLVLCHATHRKLQPWCPQCSAGGEGDRDPVLDPQPSGFRDR